MLAEKKTFHAGPCRKTVLRPEEKLVGRDQRPLVARKSSQGQGSVTALVVQDIFGGEIAKTAVSGAQHFYNIIDGVRWDFTFTQFDLPVGYQDHPANRTEVMATITPLQYAYLSACIRKALGHG